MNDALCGMIAEIAPWMSLDEILSCDFSNMHRPLVHDWRGYIPDDMRQRWQELSTDARLLAYIMAEKAADAEEWD